MTMLSTFSVPILTVKGCSNDLTTFPDDNKRLAFRATLKGGLSI